MEILQILEPNWYHQKWQEIPSVVENLEKWKSLSQLKCAFGQEPLQKITGGTHLYSQHSSPRQQEQEFEISSFSCQKTTKSCFRLYMHSLWAGLFIEMRVQDHQKTGSGMLTVAVFIVVHTKRTACPL